MTDVVTGYEDIRTTSHRPPYRERAMKTSEAQHHKSLETGEWVKRIRWRITTLDADGKFVSTRTEWRDA